jgi:hypothetical protein
MKQKEKGKHQKQLQPNPKSKSFLGKWGEGWSLGGALGSIASATHSCASPGLDTAVVIIDRMTKWTDPEFFRNL